MSTENESAQEVPKWLKRIQHGSWEPEIVLSGMIVFSLFQLPDAIEHLHTYLNREIGLFSGTRNLVALLEVAVYWLIMGFVTQLILRGVWIGMVGLSYIFPQGIQTDNLPYDERFKKYIGKNTNLTRRAIRLEKISSGVFSLAFLFFMSMLGAFILFAVFGFGAGYIIFKLGAKESEWFWDIYNVLLFTVFGIYLFDFLSLGLVKRIKWFSKIYYPIYRFLNFFTLSFTYRHIYYAFVSNINKWKIFGFLVVYFILSMGLVGIFSQSPRSNQKGISNISFYSKKVGMSTFYGHYENLSEGNFSERAHIQSDIITGNTVRLFVAYNVWHEDSLKAFCNFDESISGNRRDSLALACMNQFYGLIIDDSTYVNPNWLFHKKQTTQQKGLMTWIDVSYLNKGSHTLVVTLNHPHYTWHHAKIPFYKE